MFGKQTELFELKSCLLSTPCGCGNQRGYIFPSDNKTHAGFIKCTECDRHLKWVSKDKFERAKKSNLVNDK
jgi:hypothetical protein